MAQSERVAWETVRRDAELLRDVLNPRSTEGRIVTRILATTDVMLGQLARGFHENPALVVWPNPPGECMSRRVYELAYKHEDDGEDYKHQFSPGVHLYASGDNRVLLCRPDGKPLSKDF